jgi:transglutaminase-like putative cysteine protease
MKIFGAVVAILFFSSSVFAFQDMDVEWGVVTENEWAIESFPGDDDAHSIILFDVGESYVDFNLNVVHTRHKRIKILDPENSDYNDIRIPVYNDRDVQRLRSIQAQTINRHESGQEEFTEIGRREFYSETSGDFEITTFAFPAVQKGSIVEYKVEYRFGSPVYLPDWEFQHASPILYSEYRAMVPDYLNYRVYIYGYQPFENLGSRTDARIRMGRYSNAASGRGQNTFYQLVLRDAPAIRAEPYITSLTNYKNRVRFNLRGYTDSYGRVHNYLHTWEEIADQLNKSSNFGRELSPRRAIRREVDEITAGLETELEKATALYKYVSEDIQWDRRFRVFTSGRVTNVLDEKTGSTADKAILLVSMLRAAGLNANPVVISTRENGRIDWSYPSLGTFNHVIVLAEADGHQYLLDPILPIIPFGMLFPSTINGSGLHVDDGEFRIVDILPTIESASQQRALIHLHEDGSMASQLSTTFTGYEAIIQRRLIEEDGEDSYIENELLKYLPDSRISDTQFLEIDNPDQPLQVLFSVENDRYAAVAGDMMYINPFLLDRLDENPFNTPQRTFPVEFNFGLQKSYIATITIPDNFEVVEIPENSIQRLTENTSFRLLGQQVENTVQLMLTMVRDDYEIEPDDYHHLRDFYASYSNLYNQQIVLRRVSSDPETAGSLE